MIDRRGVPMGQTISAHFDGKVIVPDEPIQLPVGQSLRVVVELAIAERPRRQLGTLKGSVRYIAEDFDAALDEFKEYTD
jgi:hypothetical protein